MEGNGLFMMKTQHAIGALVGSAVGDALGAPFEFQRPGLYRATYPSPLLGGIGEMRGGGGFGWKPAEFTDDTQMALALAESLIARSGFDPADLWQRWRTWAETARDVGAQTRTVLAENTYVGVAERFHMQRGKSAGNGSVMRNTPIALWTAEDSLESLADLAGRQASLTHHDPHNAYGATIHAAMIRAGIRGEDVFDAIESAFAVLPSAARDLWTPLLASGWSPDTSSNNGKVFLVDKADPHNNENPLSVLEDVVATIDALLADDASRPILVHCHGGRSRTAFVLKGWAMRRFGWTEDQAHDWLVRAWPRSDRMNGRFVEILRSTWRKES